MRRSKAFLFGFVGITFSWMPGQIVTGHHLLLAFVTATCLFGGLALMVVALSAGFVEQRDSTSLGL